MAMNFVRAAGRVVISVGLVAGGVGLGVVAERTILDSATRELVEPPRSEPLSFGIQEYDFGHSIPIAVRVEWSQPTLSVPFAGGVVTHVAPASEPVAADFRLIARISEVPVFVAGGELPSYRDISFGDDGPDVAQLQRTLVASGFLAPEDVDGEFGTVTLTAVKELYVQHGSTFESLLPLGSLLFLPEGSVALVHDLAVGEKAPVLLDVQLLDSSEPVLTGLVGGVPGLGPGLTVGLDAVNTQFDVTNVSEVGGEFELALESAACRRDCVSEFAPPSEDATILSGQLELAPPVSGLAVPVSALSVDGEGRRYLVSTSGDRVVVSVLQTRDGLAMVAGVEEQLVEGSRYQIGSDAG